MEEKKVIEFVNKKNYTQDSIEVFLFENNSTPIKLLKILFKLSTSDFNSELVTSNIIDLINIILSNLELSAEEIIVNKQRIEKLASFLESKFLETQNIKYKELLDKVKRIIIDKTKNIDEVEKLVIKLIDRKETIHVIIALINGVNDINSDGKLFNYVFRIMTSKKKLDDYEQIYYTELLKVFYSKSIDKRYYTGQLDSIKDIDNVIYNEIYNIIYGKPDSLSKKEIEYKYGIYEKLITSPISPRTQRSTSSADVFTFDTSVYNIKDDGLSIRKDGNKYIVGIHMSDVGSSIRPESLLDIQARNITKEIYLPDRKIHMIPGSAKAKLSLDKGTKRGSISLYVVMSEYGEIIDYYLSRDDINIRLNLSYDDALRIIERKHPNDLERDIQKLYHFSDLLRRNSIRNDRYVAAKSNKFGRGLYNSKGFLMISEFMILYNSLIPKLTNERDIPFIYKAKDKSYIPSLIESEKINLDDETLENASNVFLDSYFSSTPHYHMTLGKKYYANCSAPMRKYSSLYNQYLLHMFFFKDQNFRFNEDDYFNLIEYLNDRGKEIDLYARGYERSLKKH